ncbi:Uncharacterised protein [Mycobacteroides abscessus subsp. abscessus]|nr:Uncharacterised protein [Mycobacteroides abscessus subsp. abscessus]
MLHHDQRGAVLPHGAQHRVAHLLHPSRVQVGGGLIQQQQTRAHREDPGQSQALLLPAGQRRRRTLPVQVQAHRRQGLLAAGADLLAGHPEVLRPEGEVLTHPGEHDRGLRVLLHQPHPAPSPGGGEPVDQGGAQRRVLLLVQHPGQGVQERGLPGAGGPQQQHLLPRRDLQGDVAEGRLGPVGVVPAEALGGDGGRARRHRSGLHRGQAGRRREAARRASRPAATESRTPVATSPRVSAQAPRPARTSPETAPHST